MRRVDMWVGIAIVDEWYPETLEDSERYGRGRIDKQDKYK